MNILGCQWLPWLPWSRIKEKKGHFYERHSPLLSYFIFCVLYYNGVLVVVVGWPSSSSVLGG